MLLKLFLLPFSFAFGIIAKLRWFVYNSNIIKRKKSTIPSIVVGNIRVGGTGKTPMVLFLAKEFVSKGIKPAILSRGYGRKTKGFLEVKKESNSLEVGDEPLMMKLKLPELNFFVCGDRIEGIQKIKELYPLTPLVLLDDAFQHFRLKADFYILLSEYNQPFYKDYPLPAGMLREFRSAAKRSDIVISTKTPFDLDENSKENHKIKIASYTQAPHFYSFINYSLPVNMHSLNSIEWDSICNKQITLLTGISNPNPLINFLNNIQVITTHYKFADHQQIKKEFLKEMCENAKTHNQVILTTEKDFARIPSEYILYKELWYTLPIEATLENKDSLVNLIVNKLQL